MKITFDKTLFVTSEILIQKRRKHVIKLLTLETMQ